MNNVNSLLDLIQTNKKQNEATKPTNQNVHAIELLLLCVDLAFLFRFNANSPNRVPNRVCNNFFFLAFMLFRPCVLFTSCVLPVIIFTGVCQFYTVQHMTSLLLKEMFKLAHDKKMVLFVLHLNSFWN